MITTAIIQARLGSTRLPGKVLMEFEGSTALEHMLARVKRARTLEKIIIATTDKPEDEVVVDIAKKCGVDYFRGSEEDVLDRYYQAAKRFRASVVVRLTGDCQLMDHAVIDHVVNFYLENRDKYDYVSNVHPPTYPDGMDVEIMSFDALEKAWKEAKLASEHEHVTSYIWDHPEIFRLGNIENNIDLSFMRLTLDNQEDFTVICAVFEKLYHANKDFGLEDIVRLYYEKPEIFSTNQEIKRNEGYAKSLKED